MMSTEKDDELFAFAEEEELDGQLNEPDKGDDCWRILVVDDEPDIYKVTAIVLKNFSFMDKGLELVYADSAMKAIDILKENDDFALILLDVVMEHEYAGLAVVKYLRETLNNNITQVVLRTGQPGVAPEKQVMLKFMINDYKSKAELSAEKLELVMISSLRAYFNAWKLDEALQEANSSNKQLRNLEIQLKKLLDDKAVELSENRNRYLALFMASTSGIIMLLDDLIVDANPAAGFLLNEPEYSDLKGKNFFSVFCDNEDLQHKLVDSIEKAKQGEATEIEIICTENPEHSLYLEVDFFKPPFKCNGNILVVLKNIEKRKKAELSLIERNNELTTLSNSLKEHQKQLIHSEKMVEIGQLAAGVAHEINNPIGYIKSNLSTLKEYNGVITEIMENIRLIINEKNNDLILNTLETISKIWEKEDIGFLLDDMTPLLDDSIDGVNRIKEIILNLKSFVRKDDDLKCAVNLNDNIEGTLKVVWNDLKYHCKIEKKYGEIPDIMCHSRAINQVIMNILLNAGQAIDKEGVITISTYREDNMVKMAFSDTGCGMSEQVKKQIFDPFYSTKEVDTGTGLGLSVSQEIIENHGGNIEVESEVGQGTTFTVALPVQ